MRPITYSILNGPATGVPIPLDLYLNPFNVSLQVTITGAPTYTVEFTNDDVYSPTYNPASGNWTALAGMTAATANANATLISPATAVRIRQTAGVGPANAVQLRVTQAGAAQ